MIVWGWSVMISQSQAGHVFRKLSPRQKKKTRLNTKSGRSVCSVGTSVNPSHSWARSSLYHQQAGQLDEDTWIALRSFRVFCITNKEIVSSKRKYKHLSYFTFKFFFSRCSNVQATRSVDTVTLTKINGQCFSCQCFCGRYGCHHQLALV